MNRLSRWFAVLLLVLAPPAGLAAVVEMTGLGEVVVPVAGQGGADRAAAVREGFAQVLVRLSGRRDVQDRPGLAGADADAFLASYRYEAGAEDAGLRLRLAFDAAAVTRLLQQARAPLWGARRPPVFLWVVRDRAGLLPQSAADVLLERARERGVPVVVPDPVLGAAAAEDGLPWVVRDAAARAGAGAVLSLRLRCGAGRCDAAGALHRGDEATEVRAAGGNEADALREAFDAAIDDLAGRLAVVGGDAPVAGVRLQVDGVTDLRRHGEIDRLLGGTPLVSHVQLESVAGERVTWLVVLSTPAERFREWLAGEGRFGRVSAVLPEPGVPRIEATLGGP